MNSVKDTKIPNIPTDRELRPTCSWCGSHESKNWIFILGRGKFYCSYEYRDASSYRIYVGSSLACAVGLILLIIVFFTIDDSEIKQLALNMSLLLLIGLGGAIMLTRNSIDARRRVQKNSKNMLES